MQRWQQRVGATVVLLVLTGLACVGVTFSDGSRAEALVPAPVAPVVIAGAVTEPLLIGAAVVGVGYLGYQAWKHKDWILNLFDHGRQTEGGTSGVSAFGLVAAPPTSSPPLASASNLWQFQNQSSNIVWEQVTYWLRSSSGAVTSTITSHSDIYAGNSLCVATGSVDTSGCLAVQTIPGSGAQVIQVCAGPGDVNGPCWTAANPTVPQSYTVTVTCRDASGNSATYTGPSQAYTPGTPGSDGNYLMPVTVPACDDFMPGSHAEQVTVNRTDGFGTQQIYQAGLDPTMNAAGATYADCLYSSGDTPCTLKLQWSPVGQTTWADCTLGGDWHCANYQVRTDFAYQCIWGTHVMQLSDCADMDAQGYYGTSTTAPPTQVQISGGTGTNTDPTTGQDSTATTGPAPDATDTTGSNCMGGIWSWNPVNWVYVPIKCALTWAFVPKEADLEAQTQTVHESVENSSIGTFFGAIGDFAGAFMPGDNETNVNCAGPAVSIPAIGLNDIHPLDACSEPMATLADYVHTILTVGVWVGMVLLTIKVLGGAVGVPNPYGSGDGDGRD